MTVADDSYYFNLTVKHETTYDGLVDILLKDRKEMMKRAKAKCYCIHCVSSADIIYAYYYSCIKNNNVDNGLKFLISIELGTGKSNDYAKCRNELIAHIRQLDIADNLSLMSFFLSQAICERNGIYRISSPGDFDRAMEQLNFIDMMIYDAHYAYDNMVQIPHGEPYALFVDKHRVNPKLINFLNTLKRS